MTHNAAGIPLSVTLRGQAIGVVAEAPLAVSVTELTMSNTQVNNTSRKTFSIKNNSKKSATTTVTVTGSDASQFSVTPVRVILSAGRSRVFTVVFAPTSAGTKSASLSIGHNAGGNPLVVTLKGKSTSSLSVTAGSREAALLMEQGGVAKRTLNLPAHFILNPNFPNPFNSQTIISYQLPEATKVRLEIFNMVGQRIRVLVDSFQSEDSHQAVWDGKNEEGDRVGSGIYFYRMQVGAFSAAGKLVLLE